MSEEHRGPRGAGETDEVARLVAAAGSRPDVREEIASLRDPVHAAWRASLEADRARTRGVRLRWLALAAGMLALLAVGWLGARLLDREPRPFDAPVLAAATRLDGTVTVYRADGASTPLSIGDSLEQGVRIETGGEARAALSFGATRSLRLDRDTSIVLVGRDRLELRRGELYLDSGPGASGSVAVSTPLGTAREVGTRFAVAVDASALVVRVRDGKVLLEHDGASVEVAAGEEVVRAAEGALERRSLSASDPAWEWVVRTAPPFELEGRTAAEYLGWLSRETGWRIVYESPGASAAAAAAVMRGSLGADDPRDTLEVLLGAELEYRLEDEVLHVRLPRR